MTSLNTLADRIEKADGHDPELDIAIAVGAAGWTHQPHVPHNFKWHDGRFDVPGPPPKFTSSLDAALTLVDLDEGVKGPGHAFFPYICRVTRDLGATYTWSATLARCFNRWEAEAATPALALCAAALRARSTPPEEAVTGE